MVVVDVVSKFNTTKWIMISKVMINTKSLMHIKVYA